ncbi:hypothetical protein [Xanthomonas sp. NCPPB 2632]|jgi:hypothetical protein|uniref:hypothetical protein n=1 Tax=Xanthomonas sp. NCPPB 2632 TaxID=3240912 RepID=UPI003517BA9D
MNLSRSHTPLPEASSASDVFPSAPVTADIDSMLRLQRIRRANLIGLMEELGPEGLEPRIRKSKLLGLSREALQRAIGGGGLAEEEAREVEWAMNRPRGWLDADHRGEPD